MRPYRNTKNDMTFEKADRMEARKHKQTLNFFQDATAALASRGKEDEAFYFEMVADHIQQGGSLDDKVERILGL
tara:strand:+ start:137 stop:358 length:222 start_codon:yes stop_codon:yes gene_type:complete